MPFTSRRRFLAATGSAVTATLAGCLGGGSADSDSLSTDDHPALGDEDAPVRMVVFEDFSCSHCASYNQQIAPQVVDDYVTPGDVLYFHADFPIPVDETWSYAVASAARAVFEEAGHDAFWSFSSAIYQQQGQYSYDLVEEVADEVAEVGQAARDAAENDSYRETVDDDREMGEEWGVSGTPTVFVGDEQIEGGYQDIADAIEEQR